VAKLKRDTTYTKNPGLSGSGRPTLIRNSGERILAQTELSQLQEKRDKLQAQVEELDEQILQLKTKRKDELLAELRELGLDTLVPGSGASGTRKGRPKGYKMSEEQKQALKDGRARAKNARAAGATSANEQP
jgi:hypothetical protein